MTYNVSCRLARKHGAIGISYPIAEIIEADTAEQAEATYRERYETMGPPVVVTATGQEVRP